MKKSLKGKRYINSLLKRIIEIIEVLIFSPFAILLIGIAIIGIKLENGGDIFYKQYRMGRSGKEFLLYKLRTMQESSLQYVFPILINDPRVTKIGKIIRRLAIDEFPQVLINVLLMRNMSIFGIRAVSTEQYNEIIKLHLSHPDIFPKELIQEWKESYDMAPPGGLSLAIVKGRFSLLLNHESLYKKMLYDIEYVKNASFFYDLWILKETIYFYI